MNGCVEFTVPDPSDDNFAWRVRYYPHSGNSWWHKMYVDAYGRYIATGSLVPPADDPMIEENDPDYYGGLA